VSGGSAHIPDFAPLIGAYLARQEWAQAALGSFGEPSVRTEVVDTEIIRLDHPGLASVVVDCRDCTFHLVLGWRWVAVAPGVLGARAGAVLGPARDPNGDVLVYDALADSELIVALLAAASGGRETAQRGRVVQSLVSHASIVYDDRLLMKSYRVIEPRPRPEVEMALGLDSAGFNFMLAPAVHWRRNGRDLALAREYLPGAVEGLALARTSLRDLLARAEASETGKVFEDVGLAGGDLGPEMRRLGVVAGRMHLALAEAFGVRPLAPPAAASVSAADAAGAGAAGGAGAAIRVHGDFHLRRVMRTDGGWVVAGFGDDPLMGAAAGSGSQGEARFASPLEDVADLCRSLHLAASEEVDLQSSRTRAHAQVLARGWERHNIAAFVKGYVSLDGIDRLLPPSESRLEQMLGGLIAAREEASRR
jgi:maltokinase